MTSSAMLVIVTPTPPSRAMKRPVKRPRMPVIMSASAAAASGDISKAFSPQGASGSEIAFIAAGVTQIAAT